MVNLFVSHRCPVKSAKALDNKRLSRLCYEAYEVLSSVVRKLPVDELKPLRKKVYQAPKAHFNHPVVNWVIQDRLHFEWTLLHAEALNEEYQARYNKAEPCKPHSSMNKFLRKALKYIPSGKYDHNDVKRIDFEGFFNFNQFKSEYSPTHEGTVVLPKNTSVITRYRLYMLHKWLYLDARDVTWPAHGPAWAYNPLYREWLIKHFGKFKNKPSMLNRKGGAFVKAIHNSNSKNLDLLAIASKVKKLVNGTSLIDTTEAQYCTIVSDRTYNYCYYLSKQWSNAIPLVVLSFSPDAPKREYERLEGLAKELNCGGIIHISVCAWNRRDGIFETSDPYGEHNEAVAKLVVSQVVSRWRQKPKLLLCFSSHVLKFKNGKTVSERISDTCGRYSNLIQLKLDDKGFPMAPEQVPTKILPERYLPW